MEVRIERIPATIDADPTVIQLISDSTAAVPIVASAVCATVRIALVPAALMNSFVIVILLYFSRLLNRLSISVRCCFTAGIVSAYIFA